MNRPIPGTPSLEYRNGAQRYQRCSRCHRERALSSLVLSTERASLQTLNPIMVGNDLVGVLCDDCVHSVERYVQSLFPDGHAFPFVDATGQLMPTPRCDDCGMPLVFGDDGSCMVCPQCDVTRDTDASELASGPTGAASRDEPKGANSCAPPDGVLDS